MDNDNLEIKQKKKNPTNNKAVVTGINILKVTEEPKQDSVVLTMIPLGEHVVLDFIKSTKEYFYIFYKKTFGYVLKKYVRIIK